MDPAKIILSEEEMQLVQNTHWILLKNQILSKAVALLQNVQRRIHSPDSLDSIPPAFTSVSPKISQGENYRGLPYRILDFPRLFGQQDRLAIRCLFWWGKFFSFTLHLRGSYLNAQKNALTTFFTFYKEAGYYISVGADEWQHHFEADNYRSLEHCSAEEFAAHLEQAEFLKMAIRLPITQWAEAENWFLENYRLVLGAISSPGDEKDL